MPFIPIKTSSGLTRFSYNISTPNSASAKSVDPNLPTILFLHPVFLRSLFWHPQFIDPRLRRFNLVAIDIRAHGETGGQVPSSFDQVEAAEDVIKIMMALNLPPCFIVGLSLGTVIGMEIAVRVPHRILGLFLMSSMGTPESAEARAGRMEMFEYWQDSHRGSQVNTDLVSQCLTAGFDLCFSGHRSEVSEAVIGFALEDSFRYWGPPNFDTGRTATVLIVTERKIQSDEALRKIQCPIRLIHGEQDLVYQIEEVETFHERLVNAGLDATLDVVPDAPHFISITHAQYINESLQNFVLEGVNIQPSSKPVCVTSPWTETILKAGWDDDNDSDRS